MQRDARGRVTVAVGHSRQGKTPAVMSRRYGTSSGAGVDRKRMRRRGMRFKASERYFTKEAMSMDGRVKSHSGKRQEEAYDEENAGLSHAFTLWPKVAEAGAPRILVDDCPQRAQRNDCGKRQRVIGRHRGDPKPILVVLVTPSAPDQQVRGWETS